jgi:hypothetical protein
MALAPTHPEWTLTAAPASARAKDIGKSGTRLKLPLSTTGSTAPEANLSTRVVSPRACESVEARGFSAREPDMSAFGQTSGAETHLELSSTAEVAPPT